jgi:hypothetical protein
VDDEGLRVVKSFSQGRIKQVITDLPMTVPEE